MKPHLALAAVVFAAISLLSATAFADSVKTDFDYHANFANDPTYSWGAIKVSDEFNADRIKRSVNEPLEQKGWTEAEREVVNWPAREMPRSMPRRPGELNRYR